MATQDKTQLSRISKLFIDRDQTLAEEALSRLRRYSVVLRCGSDVRKSYTLQVAVLTAANVANRCFPGAVRIAASPGLAEAPLLLWPSLDLTFGEALHDLLGSEILTIQGKSEQEEHAVVFGDADPIDGALRATFDGWIAKVGPADSVERLAEREYCALSGVLSASLAISELFLSFAEISIEASRRSVGFSLWRPDLPISDPSAVGIPVEFLPRDLWVLGLGHLGNAYLWSLAALPYPEDAAPQVFLYDFDKVKSENIDTGLVFDLGNVTSYKTRTCAAWLEARGFETRLVERYFDGNFRCRDDEPRLALCGFDSNPVRRHLASAQFLRVVESGLGDTADNFDTISLHTLPNPRPADELWPDLDETEKEKREKAQERMANENKAYQGLGEDECGRYELAGESIAVPFVGTTAATLVLAEIVRLLHGGSAYTDIKISLSVLGKHFLRGRGNYGVHDLAGLTFLESKACS